jgi:hypothetical protein
MSTQSINEMIGLDNDVKEENTIDTLLQLPIGEFDWAASVVREENWYGDSDGQKVSEVQVDNDDVNLCISPRASNVNNKRHENQGFGGSSEVSVIRNKRRKIQRHEKQLAVNGVHDDGYRVPEKLLDAKTSLDFPDAVYATTREDGERMGIMYNVSEVSSKKAILTMTNYEIERSDPEVPKILELSLENLLNTPSRKKWLHPMETVLVKTYAFKENADLEPSEIRTMLDVTCNDGVIRPQAIALKVELVTTTDECTVLGLVDFVTFKKKMVEGEGKQNQFKKEWTAKVFATRSPYPRKLTCAEIDFTPIEDEFKKGSIVRVIQSRLPQDTVISEKYHLQGGSPLATGLDEVRAHQAYSILYIREADQGDREAVLRPNSINNPQRTALPVTDILAASNLIAWYHKRNEMRKCKFDVVLIPLPEEPGWPFMLQAELSFESDKNQSTKKAAFSKFMEATKYWSEGATLNIEIADIKVRGLILRRAATFESKVIKIDIQTWVDSSGDAEDDDIDTARIYEPTLATISLDDTRTGLENRIQADLEGNMERVASGESVQSEILRAVLGKPFRRPWQIPRKMTPRCKQARDMLNEMQSFTLGAMQENETRFVYQQAPAGTGKTYTIAVCVLYYLLTKSKETNIVLASPTNHAMKNMAIAVLQACGEILQKLGMLVIVSKTGEEKVKTQEKEPWLQRSTLALIQSLMKESKLENLASSKIRSLKRYIGLRSSESRIPAGERAAMQVLLEVEYPKITFLTTHMLEVVGKDLTNTSILIYDEAGQIPFGHVAFITSILPNLKKLLITGDACQLPVYDRDVPPYVVRFAFESVIDRAKRFKSATETTLNESWRSHLAIVKCLSEACYEGQLRKAEAANERLGLVNSVFPLPNQKIPIVLIHVPERDEEREGTSRANARQNQLAVRMAQILKKTTKNMNIGLLSLYSFQTKLLANSTAEIDIESSAVDSFQGREVDLEILVTTRSEEKSSNEEMASSTEFVLNNRRATTALSRARHGLVIIGNIDFITEGDVYGSFVRNAALETPILTEEYIDLIESGKFYRNHHGIICNEKGRTPLAEIKKESFNKRWRMMNSETARKKSSRFNK